MAHRSCGGDAWGSRPHLDQEAMLPVKVRLRYGQILLSKGQFKLCLLGGRSGSRLRGHYCGHKSRDARNDGLHQSNQWLDLVGEAKEVLDSDN
ncbi:hypothetical protein B296_00029166 [Ensete ventricosum]|uniref:Uncharacterized protein n=1 Tax=Ensete ventricosum TaxID=4639 RepID=A0A426YKL3_ENSVE|nr:hypothetical protein B296_00029166 [Ensete ventricosum]